MSTALPAMDRSARRIDSDGRLHVELTPLTKANICEYFGREIPDAEGLGLDPERKYSLFRSPEELKKAVASFNNIPVVHRHPTNEEGPLTADNPQEHLIVGSTGTDAIFNDPFLENSMVIWKDTAIEGVMSKRKKQLSAGYRYVAVMEPGTYLGAHFDGRMTEIVANHEALVIEGRAGADVMVTDALPFELKSGDREMPKVAPSRKALFVSGALAVHLRPKLAKDAQLPNLREVLLGTTSKNWVTSKPMIITRLKDAMRSVMATDASMEDMHGFLDSLDEPEAMDMEDDTGMDETPEEKEKREKKEAEDKAAKDEDAETEEERAERMKRRAEAKDKAAKDKAAKDKAARDEETPEEKKKREMEEMRAKDNEPKPVTKAAMDQAIATAQAETRAEMLAAQRALNEAVEIVKPVTGVLAYDSAEDTYRYLFQLRDIDVTGVHPSAFKALAKQAVKAAHATPEPVLAMDHAAVASLASAWPEVTRIRTI